MKFFKKFEPEVTAFYDRAANRVIYKMNLPASELGQLKTIDDVLAIPGIRMTHQNTPKFK
ncbi:MAG: hypothetical protein AABY00_04220 [Nanoarchaeota archaeon]